MYSCRSTYSFVLAVFGSCLVAAIVYFDGYRADAPEVQWFEKFEKYSNELLFEADERDWEKVPRFAGKDYRKLSDQDLRHLFNACCTAEQIYSMGFLPSWTRKGKRVFLEQYELPKLTVNGKVVLPRLERKAKFYSIAADHIWYTLLARSRFIGCVWTRPKFVRFRW